MTRGGPGGRWRTVTGGWVGLRCVAAQDGLDDAWGWLIVGEAQGDCTDDKRLEGIGGVNIISAGIEGRG